LTGGTIECPLSTQDARSNFALFAKIRKHHGAQSLRRVIYLPDTKANPLSFILRGLCNLCNIRIRYSLLS
jgi:hypothetical protein